MKLSFSKIAVSGFIFLLLITAFFDLIYPVEHPNRYIAVYIQALLLGISIIYLINSYISNIEKTPLHKSLLIFILVLVIYGLFTPNLSILPVLLYALCFFYLAYYLTYQGYLKSKHIEFLSFILLLIYSYETYVSLFSRSELYGDFFRKADNVGYKSLFLMLIYAIDLRKTRNIIFLSITYLLVLLSFKRGAMLSGTLAYIIAMWPLITGKFTIKRKDKRILGMISFFVLTSIVFISIQYWDVLIFRFISDETGGSGRNLIYSEILRGWKESGSLNQIFGNGLFMVPSFLETSFYGAALYAHSDWYELLYDHGLFGVIIYLSVIITAFKQRKIVYRFAKDLYYPYLMTLVVWITKSYYSGIYINKGSVILFLVIGIILGITYSNKSRNTIY